MHSDTEGRSHVTRINTGLTFFSRYAFFFSRELSHHRVRVETTRRNHIRQIPALSRVQKLRRARTHVPEQTSRVGQLVDERARRNRLARAGERYDIERGRDRPTIADAIMCQTCAQISPNSPRVCFNICSLLF